MGFVHVTPPWERDDTRLCQCDRHDPPLFAACGAKAAPGELFCAWCKSGHPGGLDTLRCVGRTVGRTVGRSLKLWAQRTFR